MAGSENNERTGTSAPADPLLTLPLRLRRLLYSGAASGITLRLGPLMTGCAVTTEPLDAAQVAGRVQGDREQMYANQEPVRAPLTL